MSVAAVAPGQQLVGVRIAIAYDCLFPWTVGGAERWYRHLAEALVAAGASVTYLTRRQWDEPPSLPGIEVIAVSPEGDLYDPDGRRLLGPTLQFGAGVAAHLASRRRAYDIVQLANFPFWSLLGARAALAGSSTTTVVVDWHEVWSAAFWRDYAGPAVGSVGFAVQRLCLALSPNAVTTSIRNGQRLRKAGCRADPVVLPGYLPTHGAADRPEARTGAGDRPYALFAGRHIRDKGIDLLPDLAAELTRRQPAVDLVIAGDGPGRSALEAELGRRGLGDRARCVGFVSDDELAALLGDATCVVVPSRREGYGMFVVEATKYGTPAVVGDFPENLATDHISDGQNGFVSQPTAADLATGVHRALAGGGALRRSTYEWFRRAAAAQTIDNSARTAIQNYARLTVGAAAP